MQDGIRFPKSLLGLTEQFSDIKSLETQVLNFHKHSEKNVFVNLNGDFSQAENFKGIYNETTQKVDGILTQRYKLIRHTDAMIPLVDMLRQLGLTEVSGYTFCNGKRAYAMVWFEDTSRQIEVKKGDIIKLGILVSNSVDGTLAMWGQVMGLRLICMNGMVTENLIKSFNKIHLGEGSITEEAGAFFKDLIINITQHSEILRDIIGRNIGEMINSKIYDEILNGINLPEKHIKAILENLKEFDSVSKWDLYNHVTEYITHQLARGSLERRLTMLKFANKILITDADTFIEMSRQRETSKKGETVKIK